MIQEHEIPDTLQDWMRGGPWEISCESIWPKVMRFGKTRRKWKPFVVYKRGGEPHQAVPHEMAHMIVCEDKDVMDPMWGMPVWIDLNPSWTHEQVWTELRVLITEAAIAAHIGLDAPQAFPYMAVRQVITTHPSNDPTKPWSEAQNRLYDDAHGLHRTLSIVELWCELKRKYELVRTLQRANDTHP